MPKQWSIYRKKKRNNLSFFSVIPHYGSVNFSSETEIFSESLDSFNRSIFYDLKETQITVLEKEGD